MADGLFNCRITGLLHGLACALEDLLALQRVFARRRLGGTRLRFCTGIRLFALLTVLRALLAQVVNYKRLGAAEVEAIRESGGNADSQMDTVDLDAVDRPVRLATIDEDELAKIEAIETVAPLSSKSDMIVKHVKQ